MDLLSVAKDFGLPALGAVAGWVTTSYLVRGRVKRLEQSVTALKKGWRIELDTHKEKTDESTEKLKTELSRIYKELKEQLKEIEDRIQDWQRESSTSFARDDELTRFIEEQQRQWQAIQRTLGQIEGMLKHLK